MILVIAGTSDARELALRIQGAGYPLIATVVTENAAKEMEQAGIAVRTGRMDADRIASFIQEKAIEAVVDASHPFAEEASKNAMKGAEEAGIPYIRYERASQNFQSNLITYADSYEEAADLAVQKGGVIMLTTGSKTLQIFTAKLIRHPEIRLLARMLPRKDNMEKCEELGLPQKNIIAIQGPFTKEFNRALYKQYGVTLMITKESGKEGTVDEKLEAAVELGINTIMIGRPQIAYQNKYSTFNEVMDHLHHIFQTI
ncbi:precorrin-6A reductase [Aneurinibacillus sp. Ricciae_BoGa-3]|uniref:precorrin-6A reductase n=1 Tax=Aneurinibacillus sp. Ricciae_BoGa-3 TaxID=3022697 RepID=UPI00233FC8E8|nr:precorrin-6A reductase [Aneurinibacillus sp. Ricciae_BoGa-3]WCK56471.1 precorrin-6A reductase [Aneurinibacillus sp. Ricciae_BoGa-3]